MKTHLCPLNQLFRNNSAPGQMQPYSEVEISQLPLIKNQKPDHHISDYITGTKTSTETRMTLSISLTNSPLQFKQA